MNWLDLKFFKSGLFKDIKLNLRGQDYLPAPADVFKAFEATPFEKVKVVILGQDPYPTPGHAHGMAFSVKEDVTPIPPSLKNIFEELVKDIDCDVPKNGNLNKWAEQGVLLLNTALTVEPRNAGSHLDRGWHNLASEVVTELARQKPETVFMLWGKKAKSYSDFLPRGYKNVLKTSHPSPLAAYRGFHGSKPFSKANKLLKASGQEEIDWSL